MFKAPSNPSLLAAVLMWVFVWGLLFELVSSAGAQPVGDTADLR
jgi:hypothetical protein